jgi:hypothetical protein
MEYTSTQSPETFPLYLDDCCLGINVQVNESLGITAELKIISQFADFNNHILSFLAYGATSIAKTLNQTSFHMPWMVKFEVEILAGVVGFL